MFPQWDLSSPLFIPNLVTRDVGELGAHQFGWISARLHLLLVPGVLWEIGRQMSIFPGWSPSTKGSCPLDPIPAMRHQLGRGFLPRYYGRRMTFLCHHQLRCQWGTGLEDWVMLERSPTTLVQLWGSTQRSYCSHLFLFQPEDFSESNHQGQKGPTQYPVGQVLLPSGKHLETSLTAMVPSGMGGIPRSVLQTENQAVASQSVRAWSPSPGGLPVLQSDWHVQNGFFSDIVASAEGGTDFPIRGRDRP